MGNRNDVKDVVVKIGGRAAAEQSAFKNLALEMKELGSRYRFFFVHGGGAEVTKLSEALGITARFENGVRLTSEAEMDVVDMVLAGKMNKYIVRLFAAEGIDAVGISGCDGSIFTGKPVAEGSRTGKITASSSGLLNLLAEGGYLPVVSSVSMTVDGTALNINADEAALSIAAELKADSLVFISDIPGILKDGSVISTINPTGIESEIAGGVISGGMIPKVTSSAEALGKGVSSVIIGGYSQKGDLAALLAGNLGTRICNE